MAEEPFGRLVLQTQSNEVLSLDLYEAPDLVARGFHLLPPFVTEQWSGPSDIDPFALREVELTVERDLLEEIESSIGATGRYLLSEGGRDSIFLENWGFELNFELTSPVVTRPDQGREFWSGVVHGIHDWEWSMSFILERSGSRSRHHNCCGNGRDVRGPRLTPNPDARLQQEGHRDLRPR